MRKSHWIISLFLATSLCAAAAVAADAASAPVQAPANSTTLENIDGTPAATERNMKDCPVNHKKEQCKHDKKECQHKNGEPCPFNHAEKHGAKSHEKCDYKNQR